MAAPSVHGDRLGVVVGSALAAGTLAGETTTRLEISTGWGDAAVLDTGAAIVLARHGLDDFTPAHRVDHHRNMAVLCAAGCDRVLALASVGALRTWPVGTVLAPFDFFAPATNPTFHEDRLGHSVPGFDEPWRDVVIDTWRAATDTALMDGGVYAQTVGPRFETPAEVRMLGEHADVVGMTVAAECILAREAGLAYAVVATVDNLGNGVAGEQLTVDDYYVSAAANQARLVADLQKVLPRLAEATRP
jgi:5'-methylthioadenosine phosphorylase